ncbi:universal stress protein [Nocardioides sp. cx-169]|uniref:universal stress protein n=1 Tax=Nocardioides sp. cx-169 TaxID=2899080 RepID=UPI001E32B841|nr:universal stress protein [Nocardioides sp. cx-169]MCD4534090.1 universal stress protein [Nocardioides sp. cx-169]
MTVVVGYIPNKYGEAALEAGITEVRRRGGDLVVVNASRGDALVDQKYLGEAGVADLERRLVGAAVPASVRHGLGSDVADAIIDAATEMGAELVVIGVRRRSPVGKMLMGSVAQRVLLDAPCDVLAVKPG